MLKKADGLPTAGRFQGVLDEARVWNVARTELQIQGSMNQELTSGSGLVARWGLNDVPGTTVTDSIATAANGTITGNGSSWVAGFVPPAAGNTAPNAPTLNSPTNAATGIGTSPTLDVGVSDPDGGTLTVTYYGRPFASGNVRPDRRAAHRGRLGRKRQRLLAEPRRRPDIPVVRHRQRRNRHHHRPHLDLPHQSRAPTPSSSAQATSPTAARTQDEATAAVIGAIDGDRMDRG